MKNAITPWTQQLMDLFYTALSDDEPEVQCNAAFASGLLIEHSDVDLSPQYLQILAALRPIFVVAPDSPSAKLNARDNAVGAVSRMVYKNPSALPLDQVLPVLFDAIPLQQDYLENRPLFRAVFQLFKVQPQVLEPYLDKLLTVFAVVLDPNAPDQVGDDIRAELIALIKALNAQNAAKIQAAGLTVFVSA